MVAQQILSIVRAVQVRAVTRVQLEQLLPAG